MAGKVKISLKLSMVGLVIGLIPFVALFGWYNYQLTDSFTKIGQTIGRSDYFDPPEVREQHRLERENRDPYERKLPLNTRNQLYELYILLISNERGWVYYSPIVVIGMLGLLLGYKNQKNQQLSIVAVAVVLTSIVIYSLFGGLGGWAFGPRYLIPAAALLCSALGIALQRFKENIPFIIVFLILSIYSLWVNIVGAMTTTQVPPKVEAVNMPNPIPYTYEYNFQLLEENKIGSLAYNVFLSDTISAKAFVYGYFLAALAVLGMATTAVVLERSKGEKAI